MPTPKQNSTIKKLQKKISIIKLKYIFPIFIFFSLILCHQIAVIISMFTLAVPLMIITSIAGFFSIKKFINYIWNGLKENKKEQSVKATNKEEMEYIEIEEAKRQRNYEKVTNILALTVTFIASTAILIWFIAIDLSGIIDIKSKKHTSKENTNTTEEEKQIIQSQQQKVDSSIKTENTSISTQISTPSLEQIKTDTNNELSPAI